MSGHGGPRSGKTSHLAAPVASDDSRRPPSCLEVSDQRQHEGPRQTFRHESVGRHPVIGIADIDDVGAERDRLAIGSLERVAGAEVDAGPWRSDLRVDRVDIGLAGVDDAPRYGEAFEEWRVPLEADISLEVGDARC